MTPEQAAEAGYFEVANARDIYPDFTTTPAIIIPYRQLDGSLATFERGGKQFPFCRARYLNRKDRRSAWGQIDKAIRYAQPSKSGTRVYFPPWQDWQFIANDVNQPIIITEGESKSVIGSAAGFPVIALGGVFNFSAGIDSLLPELLAFKWRGRDVYIIMDSDAATNPSVMTAEARLVDELMRKHGARCYIVRLPQDGEDKEALDTYLEKFGPDALVKLMSAAPALGALDAKIVGLNRSVAWIDREGMVYDISKRMFIRKDNFVNGSEYGAIKHLSVGSTQRKPTVEVSVAERWLKSPHAQRYSEILFRPGEGRIVQGEGGRAALNMWEGWDPQPGDVTPFLELSEFLFQNLPADIRDMPLRLMAYKAQHPQEKIPIAMVLIGPQGCGKSLWCDTIGAAFAPYSTTIPSSKFGGGFHSWMENTLFCQIQEVEPQHVQQYGERLKSIISDRHQMMNEKYRPERLIISYTQYVLTSNKRAVGSYSHDDRRMFVIDCPKPGAFPAATYETLGENKGRWFHSGGPQWLLHFLLNWDLQGWKPPAHPPTTAEKLLAHAEGLTLVQTIAEEMKFGPEQIVLQWARTAMAWSDANLASSDSKRVAQARAIAEALPHMPVRPFYTPEELAKLLPHVVESLQGSRMDRSMPPGQLSRELREAGINYLVNRDDPAGFAYKGRLCQFLVVAQPEEWREPITQDYFDQYLANCPTFGQLRRQK